MEDYENNDIEDYMEENDNNEDDEERKFNEFRENDLKNVNNEEILSEDIVQEEIENSREELKDDIKNKNEFSEKYAEKEFDKTILGEVKAGEFLSKHLIDEEQANEEIDRFYDNLEKKKQEIIKARKEGKIDDIDEDFKNFDLRKEEAKFKTKMGLLSQGITYDDLGDLSEDWEFLFIDTVDPEFKEIRDNIRENIKLLSQGERIQLIDNLYHSGRIDSFQYSYLIDKYTW